jgi:hypothetical protein
MLVKAPLFGSVRLPRAASRNQAKLLWEFPAIGLQFPASQLGEG